MAGGWFRDVVSSNSEFTAGWFAEEAPSACPAKVFAGLRQTPNGRPDLISSEPIESFHRAHELAFQPACSEGAVGSGRLCQADDRWAVGVVHVAVQDRLIAPLAFQDSAVGPVVPVPDLKNEDARLELDSRNVEGHDEGYEGCMHRERFQLNIRRRPILDAGCEPPEELFILRSAGRIALQAFKVDPVLDQVPVNALTAYLPSGEGSIGIAILPVFHPKAFETSRRPLSTLDLQSRESGARPASEILITL
jgi:hypothetical protein